MLNKVLILYEKKNNLVDAIIYLMEQEKIDYVLSNSVNEDGGYFSLYEGRIN